MDNDRIETLLLKLLEDMAVVKSRLDSIEEIKLDAKELASKVDKIESEQSTHHKQLQSLEARQNTLESFIRNEMTDSQKQSKTITVSVGVAVVSAIVTIIVAFL